LLCCSFDEKRCAVGASVRNDNWLCCHHKGKYFI
jgi:hypothetical protein